MHVLIATSSAFRRALYLEALNGLGHDVTVAHGGVDCVEQVRSRRPDLLLLEAPLHWGGADGVLEILQEPLNQSRTRVILLAVGAGSIDWFRLSRFRVDDVLFRLPTVPELQRAIADTAASAANHALEPTHQEACFDSALAVAEGPFQKNDREI